MSVLLWAVLVVCLTLSLYCLLCSVRNSIVYNIRICFLETDWSAYKHLLEYGEMLYNPKHYFRWTVKSWEKYLKQQTKRD